MSERDQSSTGPRPDGATEPPADWRENTTPGIEPVSAGASSGAGATAVPADGGPVGTGAHGYAGSGENYYTTPQYSTSPVTVRRPDVLAALLLVLAGLAAGITLALEWRRAGEGDAIGWTWVDRGFDVLGEGLAELVDTGLWQPLAVVLGGAALLALGLLMFVPARSHRTLGVLALVVALLAAAGVVAEANHLDWQADEFGLGQWFAVAVAALGLLGALKAMLTAPRRR